MSHGVHESNPHPADQAALYFYGELPEGDRAVFESHLAACAECRAVLDELTEIRAALAPMRAQAERSDFEWRAFMRRLDARLDAAGSGAVGRARWNSGVLAAAGVAATLALGLTAGVLWQSERARDADPGVTSAGSPDAASTTARVRAREASAEHLDRARIVLLGLANKDAGAVSADDWSYERSLAASLLPDTRLHRIAALEAGDAEMASLLNDLEVLLLQASFSAEPDRATLSRLQRYINRRDLLVRTELGI